MIFAKRQVLKKIGSIGTCGLGNAVSLRFKIYDTAFCLANCQIPADNIQILEQIYQEAFKQDVRTNEK
jgi:hypothetical protein